MSRLSAKKPVTKRKKKPSAHKKRRSKGAGLDGKKGAGQKIRGKNGPLTMFTDGGEEDCISFGRTLWGGRGGIQGEKRKGNHRHLPDLKKEQLFGGTHPFVKSHQAGRPHQKKKKKNKKKRNKDNTTKKTKIKKKGRKIKKKKKTGKK